MEQQKLNEIIEKHMWWLLGQENGERADLTDADLTDANLTRANLTRADLTDANLTRANLTRANLTDADLTDADLTDANLTRADLTDADLTRADLTRADLTDADLTRADLTDAKLWSCAGNRNEIKSLFVSEVYAITYTAEVLQIGCQRHAVVEWWGFDNQAIINMDGKKALKFWREWKDTIRMIIEKSPAKATGHEEVNE